MFLRARRIFISHSSHDDELATRLGQRLAARGLSPIVDHHPRTGIQPGQDWLRSLQDHLGRAHAVILLVTDEWRASAWCQAEHRAAKLLKKTIIPIVPEPKLHADIEPSLQRIALRPGRSAGTGTTSDTPSETPSDTTGDIPDHVVDAIVAALPSRVLANALMAAPVVVLLAGALIGVRATPDGRWDAAALRGGTFVDLRLDARGAPHMAALATDLFGRRGLHVSADCGASWSESALPAGLDKPKRLDFTADEILVSSESGLWILDRARGTWTPVDTGSAGDSVLFGRVDPAQPHNVIYGIQTPGGTTAGAGTGGAVGGAEKGELRAEPGSGGMTILDRRTSTRRSFPFQMNDIAFNPEQPDRVAIAAANDGLFISRNGLASVVPIAAPDLNAPLLVAFDRTGTIVYAGGRGGLVSFLFPETPDAPIDVRRHLTMPSGAAVHGLWTENDGRVLIATTIGLFTLANRETEAVRFAPTPLERHVNKVVRCGDRIAVATGGAGVQSLSDGATEWLSLLDSGANMPAYSGISTETFRLAFGGAYLFRSFDDGGRYQAILAPGVNATAMSASLPSRHPVRARPMRCTRALPPRARARTTPPRRSSRAWAPVEFCGRRLARSNGSTRRRRTRRASSRSTRSCDRR